MIVTACAVCMQLLQWEILAIKVKKMRSHLISYSDDHGSNAAFFQCPAARPAWPPERARMRAAALGQHPANEPLHDHEQRSSSSKGVPMVKDYVAPRICPRGAWSSCPAAPRRPRARRPAPRARRSARTAHRTDARVSTREARVQLRRDGATRTCASCGIIVSHLACSRSANATRLADDSAMPSYRSAAARFIALSNR